MSSFFFSGISIKIHNVAIKNRVFIEEKKLAKNKGNRKAG
jgi:hypothetical protein